MARSRPLKKTQKLGFSLLRWGGGRRLLRRSVGGHRAQQFLFGQFSLHLIVQQLLHVHLSLAFFSRRNDQFHFYCIWPRDVVTCHWSSCWLNSTFCWMASSSWLLICRTSMRVRASSISAAFLRATAWSRTSHARRMISSLARWVSRTSRRAVSRSSRVASNSTSFSVSCWWIEGKLII